LTHPPDTGGRQLLYSVRRPFYTPESVKPPSRKYCSFLPAFSFFCTVYHYFSVLFCDTSQNRAGFIMPRYSTVASAILKNTLEFDEYSQRLTGFLHYIKSESYFDPFCLPQKHLLL
jgi:hypothetical protein